MFSKLIGLFTKKTSVADYPDMQAAIDWALANPDRFTEIGLHVLATDEWTVVFYGFEEGIGQMRGFTRPLTTAELLALSREADGCPVYLMEV